MVVFPALFPAVLTALAPSPSGASACVCAVSGCAQQRFEGLFDETLARKALSCLHPNGEFQSAGEVHAESSEAFTGTIFWKGGVTENRYYTRVRFAIVGNTAELSVVEDTSILPALNDACKIDLGGS